MPILEWIHEFKTTQLVKKTRERKLGILGPLIDECHGYGSGVGKIQ